MREAKREISHKVRFISAEIEIVKSASLSFSLSFICHSQNKSCLDRVLKVPADTSSSLFRSGNDGTGRQVTCNNNNLMNSNVSIICISLARNYIRPSFFSPRRYFHPFFFALKTLRTSIFLCLKDVTYINFSLP